MSIFSSIGKSHMLGPVPTITEVIGWKGDTIKVFESEAEVWLYRALTGEEKKLHGLPRWFTIG